MLWTANQVAWTVREILLHVPIPDPFFFDIILFFHTVPLIAAIAWRPDQRKKEGRIFLSLLSFLMLLGWWIFLYAFIVFPHQYVVLNVSRYNEYYDQLFGLENILLLAVLGLATWTSSGGWRRLYAHFTGASLLYAVNSQLLDRAAANNTYYSGSLYDVPLMATIAWMAAAAMSSREWELKTVDFNLNRRLKKIVPQLAMLAILSLPMLGVWTVFIDQSPGQSRVFRVYAVLAAMLILGAFVFLRQYLQDQTLMALLQESRRAYESQKQLQTQLVQKEKLASLGNLIAGAACEIEYPLNAIMSYSEQLWSKEKLTEEQNTMVRKIVTQAQRTRELVVNLLSFAQQAPGEKILVDLGLIKPGHANARGAPPSGQNQSELLSIRISPTCTETPTSYFKDSSKSSRTPWTRLRKSAADPSKSRPATRDRNLPPVLRQRPRHSQSATRFRSLLYDQACRQRHGPWPERRLRRHSGSRRPDYLPEQSPRRRCLSRSPSRHHRTCRASAGPLEPNLPIFDRLTRALPLRRSASCTINCDARSTDLTHSSARVLEFEALRELLRGYTSSPLGQARIAALDSIDRSTWIEHQQELTSEIREFRRVGGRFEFSGLIEVGPLVEKSRIAGVALETTDIRDVILVVDRAAEWREICSIPRPP